MGEMAASLQWQLIISEILARLQFEIWLLRFSGAPQFRARVGSLGESQLRLSICFRVDGLCECDVAARRQIVEGKRAVGFGRGHEVAQHVRAFFALSGN